MQRAQRKLRPGWMRAPPNFAHFVFGSATLRNVKRAAAGFAWSASEPYCHEEPWERVATAPPTADSFVQVDSHGC